jgi:hypothetical protein
VVFSINKTDCHDITEILLKVALNTIKQTKHKMFAVLSDVYPFLCDAKISMKIIFISIHFNYLLKRNVRRYAISVPAIDAIFSIIRLGACIFI